MIRTPLSVENPLTRLVAIAAAVALIAFGVFAFTTTSTPTVAGADPAGSIPLHNDTAGTETDCPDTVGNYWHFVFAPNNGSASFATITLNLGDTSMTFSGAQIIPNGSQTDNVFVAVPDGYTLTDLEATGSFATYTGTEPNMFVLSHVCVGTGTTTTTTEATTTTTEATTTTTEATTTTSTTQPTTTTEATTTTSTTSTTQPTTTTSTTQPTTTTSTTQPTTTTEATTTTTEATTTTSSVLGSTTVSTPESTTTTNVLGSTTVSTPDSSAPDTAQVQGVTQSVTPTGALPYTGSESGRLLVAGGSVLAGGLLLVMLARRRNA